MPNDAMKQAWEHYRLHGLRPIPTWEEIVEGVEERAFAAGRAARDVEVAALQESLRVKADQAAQLQLMLMESNCATNRPAPTFGNLARDAEVAELQRAANVLIDFWKSEASKLRLPSDNASPKDANPLIMPIERLRECVAIEVMGWQDNTIPIWWRQVGFVAWDDHEISVATSDMANDWGQADDWWYRHLTQHSQKGVVRKADFDPLTNPVHWQMVEDRMREMGWQFFVRPYKGLSELPPFSTIATIPIWWRQVGFVAWDDHEISVATSDMANDGEYGCCAALLAVRAQEGR